MPRIGLAAIAAALLIGTGFVLGARLAPATGSAQLAAIASASMILAMAGALLGLYAALSARRTQAEVERLARSVDGALRRMAEGNDRNTSTVEALSDAINREIGGALQRIAAPPPPSEPEPQPMATAASNVVPLSGARRQQPASRAAEEALPSDWSLDAVELSLQPIIAVQQGAAAGFEVFARLRLNDGSEKDVRRLSGDAPPRDVARFERAMVKAAVETSRRQLGARGENLPLHVAVSTALLDDAAGVSELAEMFRLHAAAALVFSLPAELLSDPGRRRSALDTLSDAGVRFAAEGWTEDADPTAVLASRGVAFLKLGCDRLLDREKSRRRLTPATGLIEAAAAAGVTVIATGVASDEDAVGLVDLGIDLMQGERFSGPRRLKPTEAKPAEQAFDAPAASAP